jgi:hypothetical protein
MILSLKLKLIATRGLFPKEKYFLRPAKKRPEERKMNCSNRIKFGGLIYPRLESKKCAIFAS